MKNVVRYLIITAMVAAFGYLVAAPTDWKAYSGFSATLIAFLTSEIQKNAALKHGDADRALFKKFLEELPSTGVISDLKTLDMAGRIPNSALYAIQRFSQGWNDPEHEFHDATLESLRMRLCELIVDFRDSIIEHTHADDHQPKEWQRVPPEWHHEQNGRFKAAVSELHQLADDMFATHQELVRTGRRRLGV